MVLILHSMKQTVNTYVYRERYGYVCMCMYACMYEYLRAYVHGIHTASSSEFKHRVIIITKPSIIFYLLG